MSEINAEKLVPLLLHFAQDYLDKKDYKKLAKYLDTGVDVAQDPIVKQTGGLQGLLECFLKHNKAARKELLPTKKRE